MLGNCNNCNQSVKCNTINVKCWKTEVRVASCGISATDFPFMDDGFNQTSNLVLSAYPNTEGPGKKGCVILTDDCCDTVQVLGTWASLSRPNCLLLELTLTLNNGQNYSFATTNGLNGITPCNVACYDKDIPIWLAPAGAQPSPCIKASLLQTISQCNKTICWTLNLDTTTDSVGAAAIGGIVDVGCTKIVGGENICNCYEAFDSYDFIPSPSGDENVYGQTYVASGFEAQLNSSIGNTVPQLNQLTADPNYPGQYSIILTKGVVIEGDFEGSNSDSCSERYIRTITTQVGLYPCQVFNFWAAVYARPLCIGETIRPPEYNVDGSDIGSIIGGVNPNNKTIQWSPQLQRATFGNQFFWVVRYANDSVKHKGDGKLRFELSKATSTGNITRATTKELWTALKQWSNQLEIFSHDNTPNCQEFFTNNNEVDTSGGISKGVNTLSDPHGYYKRNMFASVTFIGIGDRCGPYPIFRTPRTGNDYQATTTPYQEAGLVQMDKSPWFGLLWSGSQGSSTIVPSTCIC